MYPLNWSVWQVGTVKRLYLLRTYKLADKVGCVVVAISAGDWGGEVDLDGSYWGHSQSCNEPNGIPPCALWVSGFISIVVQHAQRPQIDHCLPWVWALLVVFAFVIVVSPPILTPRYLLELDPYLPNMCMNYSYPLHPSPHPPTPIPVSYDMDLLASDQCWIFMHLFVITLKYFTW